MLIGFQKTLWTLHVLLSHSAQLLNNRQNAKTENLNRDLNLTPPH